MSSPSVRMLDLLSVLQDGREHSGASLAERLGASPRTLRRDLDRLRELGYPVESRRGPGGSYRLVAGSAVPPLLFADDEAVAAVVGLRMLAGVSTDGIADRALRKLEQILPSRLAHRVRAVSTSLEAVSRDTVDLSLLQALGAAIDARQDVRFTYVARSGDSSWRRVEPVRQVALGRRWYLLGFDRDRGDWRTYRLDRVSALEVPGTTFVARELPDDAVSFVQTSARVPMSSTRAVVRFSAPAAVVGDRLLAEAGALEALGDEECRFVSAPDSWEWLAITLAMVGVPYVIEGPPELVERSREVAERMSSAVGATSTMAPD